MGLFIRENETRSIKFSVSFRNVVILALSVLILPILVFFFGWLRWYYALPFSAVLLLGAFWLVKQDYWENSDRIEIPLHILLAACVVFTLWIFLSGSCWFSIGSVDIEWRNTYLQDLITRQWPVYYPEKGGYLCYYFTYWMIPALFGKLGGMSWAWVALAIQDLLILLLAFLLIAYLVKDYKNTTLKLILIFMVLWSGLRPLGAWFSNAVLPPEWGYGTNFYYRPNSDVLAQVYNQLPIWIVVPLFLENRKIRNYAFMGLLLFPFSPWGTTGIGIIMIADVLYQFFKEKNIAFMKEAFSLQNVSAIISIFCVFGLFFFGNGQYSCPYQGYSIFNIWGTDIQNLFIQCIIIFWLCEFGIYYFLTWRKLKHDFLYRVIFIALAAFPLIHVGAGWDFAMNASLPLLYILMIYLIYYIKEELAIIEHCKCVSIKNALLFTLLIIACYSSLTEFVTWKVKELNTKNTLSIQNTTIWTFSDMLGYEGYWKPDEMTFSTDSKFFFEHLAKKIDKEAYSRLSISQNLSQIREIEDLDEYLEYLFDKDCAIMIAVQDIQGPYMTPETLEKLKTLGFDDGIDILSDGTYHSFIGVVSNGDLLYQQVGGDEYICYDAKALIGGRDLHMESGTFTQGNLSVINLDPGHYSAHGRGLNIVVYDNNAERVIDSVAFDMYVAERTCTRKYQ